VDAVRIAEELAAVEGRGPCTDAERRAARLLARHVRAMGRQARTETFWVRPHWPRVWLLHAALGIAASVVSVRSPEVGTGFAAVAALSALLELSGRVPGLSVLWTRRATQNVVSRGPGDAPVRLVVAAPYNAPRRRAGFAGVMARLDASLRRSMRGRWPSGLTLLTLSLLAILGCAIARVAGADGDVLGVAQLVPTAIAIGAVAVLADLAFARPATGRNAHATAAATALALVEALDRRAPHRLAVDLVLTGAADGPALGMRAHVRSRRRTTRPEEVAVVHLEPCGDGAPHHWTHQGPVVALRLHPRLTALAAGAGGAPVRDHGAGGAYEARRARWPALAIGALRADGTARPEHVDETALEGVLALALATARALDRDLAGRSS
jgi:hypothetical protein